MSDFPAPFGLVPLIFHAGVERFQVCSSPAGNNVIDLDGIRVSALVWQMHHILASVILVLHKLQMIGCSSVEAQKLLGDLRRERRMARPGSAATDAKDGS